MKSSRSQLKILDRYANAAGHSTGVSLHCHTQYSKEMLDFLPFYAEKIPLVRHIWKREVEKYRAAAGQYPNFNTGYWEPPLTGPEVYQMESGNVAKLDVEPIISITDHDCIDAAVQVNETVDNSKAPISMEWTVPFGCAYFHLGVHNLPPERAVELRDQLLAYTFGEAGHDRNELRRIFDLLNSIDEVLIVFNHPVWDIEMIGQEAHNELLRDFIDEHARDVHTIEVNGFRPWSENKLAIEIAETLGLPIISGGDRHCMHANTVVNTTSAGCFSEFVDEIRKDKRSTVLVLPEYKRPLSFRQVASMAQILGNYPHFPEGRRRWHERVYFDAEDGCGARPLAEHWKGRASAFHNAAIGLLTFLSHRRFSYLFRLNEARSDFEPTPDVATQSGILLGTRRLAAD
ncbi:MAG: hypothetical protein IPM50_11575 [Acidobacteriota bacterium]|nr:MAG: hypothetical protein IPM50_11575 [Acidobacteriota bacterium]